jgi:hypothetical protein
MDSPTRKARPAIRETEDGDEKESLFPTDRTRLTAPLDATESAASTFFGWRMDTEAGAEKERASEARRVNAGVPDDDTARCAPMNRLIEMADAAVIAMETGLVVPPADAVNAASVVPHPTLSFVPDQVVLTADPVTCMSSATPKEVFTLFPNAWCAMTVRPGAAVTSEVEPLFAATDMNSSLLPAGVSDPGVSVADPVGEAASNPETPEYAIRHPAS